MQAESLEVYQFHQVEMRKEIILVQCNGIQVKILVKSSLDTPLHKKTSAPWHLYICIRCPMDEKRLMHQPPTPSDEWNATTSGFPEKQAISRTKTRNQMCSQRFEINKFHQLGHAQHISAPSAPLFCGLVPVVEALVLLWAAQRSSTQQLLSHWHGASTQHLSRSTVNLRILRKCLYLYIYFFL